MAKYIPENNYLDTNYTPLKGFDEPMCVRCERYYKGLFEKGITKDPFPPNCEKSLDQKVLAMKESDFDSEEEFNEASVLIDTIAWAQMEFGWEPRFYQEDMIYCTSKYKLHRLGRRCGKTESMVIETLHHLVTNRDHTVLVIAPFERQVTKIFDEIAKFIEKSTTLKGSLARYTRTPSRMDFNNGSRVLGFSAGATSGSGSDKIRGQDANLIVIDEIDTLEDKDIDAIMAILASHSDCKLIAATTPRGWRRRFYTYATNKDARFKEFWFISAESPAWTEEVEKMFRDTTDPVTYAQEYLADFAELSDGVFKTKCLNASVEDYDISKEALPEYSADYILGVDWNKAAGTHMVIVENLHGKLRLVQKIVIPESEYMQTESVDYIIDLNNKWRFKYVFVDAGYGSTQTELMRKHDLTNPAAMFQHKLFPVAMNQSIDVIDPISGEPVKRNAKHFLVQQTKKLLEDGFLVLPKSEDTTASAGGLMGLVQQMRNFRVEGLSVYGLPKYSQGQDHTLTAYYLAIGGYYWKDGDFRGAPYSTKVNGSEVSDEVNQELHPSVIERQQDDRAGWKLVRTTNKNHAPKSSKSREMDTSTTRKSGLNGLGGGGGRNRGSGGPGFSRRSF